MMFSTLGKRLTVFGAPLVVVAGWFVWFAERRAVVEVGVGVVAIVAVTVWYLTWRDVAVSDIQRTLHRGEFWRFALTPVLFTLAVHAVLLIVELPRGQYAIAGGGGVFLWLIFQNLFDRFHRGATYPARSFESVAAIINALTIAGWTACLFTLATFLNEPAWLVSLLFVGVVVLLTYQLLWIAGLTLARSWLHLAITTLCLLEFFWVLLWLPNTILMKMIVLVVGFYAFTNIAKNQLLGLVTRAMVWRYALVGGSILLFALLTAQWR